MTVVSLMTQVVDNEFFFLLVVVFFVGKPRFVQSPNRETNYYSEFGSFYVSFFVSKSICL